MQIEIQKKTSEKLEKTAKLLGPKKDELADSGMPAPLGLGPVTSA